MPAPREPDGVWADERHTESDPDSDAWPDADHRQEQPEPVRYPSHPDADPLR